MIKKASEMTAGEQGTVKKISGFKNELECMGITGGCSIIVKSKSGGKITVFSNKDSLDSDIVILNKVASKIDVLVTGPKSK
ncbi:Fe2+ transport system protein FeoA [Methanomicrobium sp. W14]|uniref:ferrous iron transport protein A n=1 Tax=Methanomicrobium sp. W14 TaxID=2817839 RepID=UPI001AE53636|nr:ferrous iron transport protein A [Methanomicrobium sp. W14]MBP2132950.1 Fe2+ transport system protein FeoA [Methanomicrobium sp. W14]